MKLGYLILTLPFLIFPAISQASDKADCYVFNDGSLSEEFECDISFDFRQDTFAVRLEGGQDYDLLYDYDRTYRAEGKFTHSLNDDPAEFYYRDPNDFTINYKAYDPNDRRLYDLACYSTGYREVCYRADIDTYPTGW